jgi:hypothetical protein
LARKDIRFDLPLAISNENIFRVDQPLTCTYSLGSQLIDPNGTQD